VELKTCRHEKKMLERKSRRHKQATQIKAPQSEQLILDPLGFFVIYAAKDEQKIYLEHYKKDGTLNEVIYGEDPISIASTAVKRGLVSRLDHAVYLGRELEKAYFCIMYGSRYIQDEERIF
jgi:tetrahydromethanopterin S-methyltransferase subunit A